MTTKRELSALSDEEVLALYDRQGKELAALKEQQRKVAREFEKREQARVERERVGPGPVSPNESVYPALDRAKEVLGLLLDDLLPTLTDEELLALYNRRGEAAGFSEEDRQKITREYGERERGRGERGKAGAEAPTEQP